MATSTADPFAVFNYLEGEDSKEPEQGSTAMIGNYLLKRKRVGGKKPLLKHLGFVRIARKTF